MDALEIAERMITICILRGNVALAREYATEYAAARDDRMTSDELSTSVKAWTDAARDMKMPRSDRR